MIEFASLSSGPYAIDAIHGAMRLPYSSFRAAIRQWTCDADDVHQQFIRNVDLRGMRKNILPYFRSVGHRIRNPVVPFVRSADGIMTLQFPFGGSESHRNCSCRFPSNVAVCHLSSRRPSRSIDRDGKERVSPERLEIELKVGDPHGPSPCWTATTIVRAGTLGPFSSTSITGAGNHSPSR